MSSGGEQEEEKPFAVERAKTGRAKCKKCKCPIEKDTVRIAKLMANPFADGKMKAWHHLNCLFEVFAKQRATTKRIDDPEEDVSGWNDLTDEEKKLILEKIEDFENSAPFKTAKAKSPRAKEAKTPKKQQKKADSSSPSKAHTVTAPQNDPVPSTSKAITASSVKTMKQPSKDDMFREFRRLCTAVADVDAYTEKTTIIKKLLTKGSNGDGFKSDIVLWCKMLLPGSIKRVYNLQSKQLIKLFARILLQDEDEMLEDLANGDVAETIRTFFESSVAVKPSSKSTLTIQEVDLFLEQLSTLTKEDEQIQHFKSILDRCTGNDLKMIIRLIKHDLRINAGPKHILSAVHQDAYEAFQTSRDLEAVITRCLSNSTNTSRIDPSKGSIDRKNVALSLMTPVLPMLAEACVSVEKAMAKCPNGMLSEVKYDGERVQVHKKGNEFRYFSRSLKPVLPHKVKLFKEYIPKAFPDGDDLILDSEVLLIDNKTGKPLPFGSLGVHKKSEFKDANVCLFVFDCIYYNGEILMDKPIRERRKILESRMTEIPERIKLSEVKEIYKPRDLAEMIVEVLKLGLEGLVLKDMNSKYEPGKRHWLKMKKDYLCGGAMADTADLVVLGAWYGTGNKGGMMSIFLMGCHDKYRDKWVTVTKVHSGHDDATLKTLQTELDMIKIGKDPSKVPDWLEVNKPMVPDFIARDPKKQPVWEITGAEFTNQGVHTADGISIRFPRVTSIRDKDWSSATTLNELRDLFKKSSESIDFSTFLKANDGEDVPVKTRTNSPSKKNKNNERPHKRRRLSDSPPSVKKHDIRNSSFKFQNDSVKMEMETESETDDVKPSTSSNGIKVEESFRIKTEPVDQEEDVNNSIDNTNIRIKQESVRIKQESKSDSELEYSEDDRAEFYSFINNDYIEYSAGGSPLNWIEGRKPSKGLPADAKPLSSRKDSELKSKCTLKDAHVSLARNFKKSQRKATWRTLKTLGARILTNKNRSKSTHVLHSTKKIPATVLEEYRDMPRNVRHVNLSWLTATAEASKAQNEGDGYAVELTADYCKCPCTHRER